VADLRNVFGGASGEGFRGEDVAGLRCQIMRSPGRSRNSQSPEIQPGLFFPDPSSDITYSLSS
jgi:hypothetical protein